MGNGDTWEEKENGKPNLRKKKVENEYYILSKERGKSGVNNFIIITEQ